MTYDRVASIWFLPLMCSAECLETHFNTGEQKIFPEEYGYDYNKPIEYRSGYEKGFHIWLKDHNIDAWYEPFRIQISGGNSYLPDFFLPKSNTLIEVKGVWEKSNPLSDLNDVVSSCDMELFIMDSSTMSRFGWRSEK